MLTRLFLINEEGIRQIELLEQEYEHNWGKSGLYSYTPGIIAGKIAVILERIVDTGESILGYNKICRRKKMGYGSKRDILLKQALSNT